MLVTLLAFTLCVANGQQNVNTSGSHALGNYFLVALLSGGWPAGVVASFLVIQPSVIVWKVSSCHLSDRLLASFPGSPSPSLKLRLHEHYVQKIEGEGEPGTELCLPAAFPAMVEQEFN